MDIDVNLLIFYAHSLIKHPRKSSASTFFNEIDVTRPIMSTQCYLYKVSHETLNLPVQTSFLLKHCYTFCLGHALVSVFALASRRLKDIYDAELQELS